MSGFISGLIGMIVGAGGLWAAIAAGFVAAPAPAPAPAPPPTQAPEPAPVPAASNPEAPAYLVVVGDVLDREAFIPGYAQKMGPIYAKYGGEYLAVGQNRVILEGERAFSSYVISKWPSMAAAQAFWDSEEYAPLKQARIENGWGTFDVFLLEGLPVAPAPAD